MDNRPETQCIAHNADPFAKLQRDIETVGWSVVGILDEPSFAYTVGLTLCDRPELYYALPGPGTPAALSGTRRMLNTIARILRGQDGVAIGHNSTISLPDDDGVAWTYLFETRLNTRPMTMARAAFGEQFQVLEVSVVGRTDTIHSCGHEPPHRPR